MTSTVKRRHWLAGLGALVSAPSWGLMAGTLPDTPEARVDANSPASAWTSSVAVLVNGGVYSGVVVAPRFVLTAAHVAGGAQPSAVTVQVNATASPVLLAATAIAVFPGASFPYDDLALVMLAEPVPDSVEVLPIYRQHPQARQVVTLVGYGSSGTGDAGPTTGRTAGVKRTGRNAIDGVQTTLDSSGRQSLFYLYDFDGPTGNGSFGGASLGNALETGLAGGDSGSPAYATIGGQLWLLGINNLTAAPVADTPIDFRFGTLCGGMLLSDTRFLAWLEDKTGGTLGQSSPPAGDVPLPAWSALLLAAGLAGLARRRVVRDGA